MTYEELLIRLTDATLNLKEIVDSNTDLVVKRLAWEQYKIILEMSQPLIKAALDD